MKGSAATSERKAATHVRILASAGRILRREGIEAASVERVMRGAGLTVGGFYAHFRSQRAMGAEALRRALVESRARWFAGLDDDAGVSWLIRAMRRYLSAGHRDRPQDGCPLPASVSGLGQASAETRETLSTALEASVAEIAAHAPAAPGVTARERALATLALAVGGLAIARALRGHPASDEILHACIKWAVPETRQARQADPTSIPPPAH